MQQTILATDLDGTFLGGNASERAALYDWIGQRRNEIVLIYVTGRSLTTMRDVLDELPLQPDHIISDVGTAVYAGAGRTPLPALERLGTTLLDDVAVPQLPLRRNSVADFIVDRGADAFGKSLIVQRSGRRAMRQDVFVADVVQFLRRHAGLDVRFDHDQHFRRQLAGLPHFVYFFVCFEINHWDRPVR